jgi:hypothetical protein
MLLSVATLCLVAGLSASACTPRATITVSPTTDLIGQQVVQVTGHNWDPTQLVSLYTMYVDLDGAVVKALYFSPVVLVTAAADGSFVEPFHVTRLIKGHDCARLGPDDLCELLAFSHNTTPPSIEVPLSFAPPVT